MAVMPGALWTATMALPVQCAPLLGTVVVLTPGCILQETAQCILAALLI